MSNSSSEFFEYKLISRLILGGVMVIALLLSTCAYKFTMDYNFEQHMYDTGYIQVKDPSGSGNWVWRKNESVKTPTDSGPASQ